ncbi:chemosensory pili system protein ChpC [Gammaproteobacteria bacterium]
MQTRSAIRSLFLPITGDPLLLPSVVLAEVIAYRMPESLPNSPPWLLGLIEWRGRPVPVVSFEELCGRSNSGTPIGTRIAILNTITGTPQLPFLGVRIQGIPRLVLVREDDLIFRQDDACSPNPNMYATIELAEQPAIIPDLESLELLLSSYVTKE